MKVVLSGYYGFDNVGDEAILYSIIQALREVDPTIEITVLSNQPEKTAETYGVKAVNRWKLKEVAKVIKQSDGLISGGGSLLQDETGGRSVIYYTGVMLMARFLGKPFFVYAQGMGPLNQTFNQRLTKFAIKKAAKITVRDIESKQLLERIGVKKDIELVPDPVLGICGGDLKSGWLEQIGIDEPFITVSVRDWPSEQPYKERLAHTLDELSSRGYRIVFIPMHGEHDKKSSEDVMKLMKKEAMIAPFDASIEEKIALIRSSHLLIGMRLHALIFATVVHTPFVALSYDPKIDSFARIVEQPVGAHVEQSWTKDELLNIVEEQLTHDEEARKKLATYEAKAKQLTKRTAELALDSFR
ncbi:MAG TPA: polysaccharide pyruvyl transferase CsaB [Bacilli bacterium]|nr:polysaccharide pyruvyl transferase CsaB [Bacilli bacterium]